ICFFFSSRRRHTRCGHDWSSDVCSSDLVRAATGEELTEEEMGGSAVHARISGVADREAADDAECLRVVRDYLSFMPCRYGDPLPVKPVRDPVERRSEKLYEIVPVNLRKA